MLQIKLLGKAQVCLFGGPGIALSPQSIGLLACLGLSRGRDCSRERLVQQLWPDHDVVRGHSALASALCRLRQALPPVYQPLLVASGAHTLRLCIEGALRLDVENFLSHVEPALRVTGQSLAPETCSKLEHGVACYGGELLAGWRNQWVLVERERLRSLFLRAQGRLLEHHTAAGDLEAAIDDGHAMLAEEPLHENVYRLLMGLYVRVGRRAAAARLYDQLLAALQAELGVPPTEETRQLRRQLLGSG